jgi:hypothetical protein
MCNVSTIASAQEKINPSQPNLILNGSFEQGLKNWGYRQWDGLPVPGHISKEKPFDADNCFILTEPGTIEPRFIRSNHFAVDLNQNYIVQITLALQDIPKDSIKLRALQYGKPENKKAPVLGWARPDNKNVYELIPDIHGTSDWKTYTIKIPGKSLDPKTQKLSIYIMHQNPSIGELKVDAVSCTIELTHN